MQEVQRKTTSSEFLLWMDYFNYVQNEHTKEDHYLAQIASILHNANSDKPCKLEDCLLKFENKPKISDVEKKINLANAKHFWLSRFGIKG